MGEQTAISWATHTFNGWWGCTEVSPGCDHCYARDFAKRTGRVGWGHGAPRLRTSPANWMKPYRWAREAAKRGVREQVFAQSMSDWNDAEVPTEWRADLFNVIRDTRYALDWLLLSKRPYKHGDVPADLEGQEGIWLGCTVESQEYMWRVDKLLGMDSVVHWVSAEPLLGPLDFLPFALGGSGINWIIAGCESSPGKRPGARAMEIQWVRSLRDECVDAGVAFHLKQMVQGGKVVELPELDGRRWAQLPVFGLDGKWVSVRGAE